MSIVSVKLIILLNNVIIYYLLQNNVKLVSESGIKANSLILSINVYCVEN